MLTYDGEMARIYGAINAMIEGGKRKGMVMPLQQGQGSRASFRVWENERKAK